MGLIATDKNKLILYYHSGTSLGKQALAYIESSDKEILAIDIAKTNVPGSHWAEMAGHLKIKIASLIDTEHPDFHQLYGDAKIKLEDHDWLKILEKSPQLLIYPVAIIGEKFMQIENPSDLEKHILPEDKNV